MKQKRYTDEQIAFALRQAESGTAVLEICRKLGVSEPTFYRWKKQFAGMGTVEIRRLKQLEEENAKLKRLVADLSLDKTMLQGSDHWSGPAKKMVRPALRREVVAVLRGSYRAASVGPVRPWGSIDLPSATSPGVTRRSSCGCGCVTWLRCGSVTATGDYTCCCGVRAGR